MVFISALLLVLGLQLTLATSSLECKRIYPSLYAGYKYVCVVQTLECNSHVVIFQKIQALAELRFVGTILTASNRSACNSTMVVARAMTIISSQPGHAIDHVSVLELSIVSLDIVLLINSGHGFPCHGAIPIKRSSYSNSWLTCSAYKKCPYGAYCHNSPVSYKPNICCPGKICPCVGYAVVPFI